MKQTGVDFNPLDRAAQPHGSPNAHTISNQYTAVAMAARTDGEPATSLQREPQKRRGTAIVTGGARRLGRAIALMLAQDGFDIALHYNSSREDAITCSQQIQTMNRRCRIFQADLSDGNAADPLLEEIIAWMPDVSLLVNSASVWYPSSFLDSTINDVQKNFALHVVAPYMLMRGLAKTSLNAQVINIIDTAVSKNRTDFFPYLLSKKCLYELTTMCAAELAPRIRVNAIAPGTVLPPEGEAAAFISRTPPVPLEQNADVSAVLSGVRYLMDSPHVTGQCLFIDGGEHLL